MRNSNILGAFAGIDQVARPHDLFVFFAATSTSCTLYVVAIDKLTAWRFDMFRTRISETRWLRTIGFLEA